LLSSATPTLTFNTGGANISLPAANTLTVSTSGVERMRIDNIGYVGIGTNNAQAYKLHVYSSSVDNTVSLTNSGTTSNDLSRLMTQSSYGVSNYQTIISTTGAGVGAVTSTAPNFYVGTSGSYPLTFITSNNTQVTINSNGNLLVGTATSPLSPTATQVVNSVYGGGTEWVFNGTGGGNVSALSGGGLSFGTFTQVIGGEAPTQRMRIDSSGNVGIGTTIPLALVHHGTGTANIPPAIFNAGTNTTTVLKGSMEYDGNVFTATNNVAAGRSYIPSTNIFRLTAAGTAIGPTIAPYYGATSNITIASNSVYECEWNTYFTKTTAGTVTFTIQAAQAPVNLNAYYQGSQVNGIATVGNVLTAGATTSTTAATALPVTPTLTTAVNFQFTVKAIIETNATTAGTLDLFITSSAGTVTPLRGSYYKITQLPFGNSGIFS
jgi:hypothetical protein